MSTEQGLGCTVYPCYRYHPDTRGNILRVHLKVCPEIVYPFFFFRIQPEPDIREIFFPEGDWRFVKQDAVPFLALPEGFLCTLLLRDIQQVAGNRRPALERDHCSHDTDIDDPLVLCHHPAFILADLLFFVKTGLHPLLYKGPILRGDKGQGIHSEHLLGGIPVNPCKRGVDIEDGTILENIDPRLGCFA